MAPHTNLASDESFSCRFSFSVAKNANTKATEFVNLDFYFCILVVSPSKKVWTSLSVSDTDFFSVLPAIIRESSDKLPCAENREGFAVHSSICPSGTKGKWRAAADWPSTHVKNYDIFHVCCYGFSQGWKSLNNTAVYVIIIFFTRCYHQLI